MKYTLPPLHTLRTFEALCRLQHFTRTAEHLHLTTSAVSHQIRAIESFYATKLFRRNRNGVTLTPAGERLATAVREALQLLSTASKTIRVRDANRLSVTVPPSLASRWLMPRLGSFLQRHPGIDFQLRATPDLVELDSEDIDLGIRFGGGNWKDLRSEKLFNEEIFPVASPAYLKRNVLRGLADLSRGILLRDEFYSWEDWFEHTKMNDITYSYSAVFNDSALLLQAAEEGQGVVLARSLLVADAIAVGLLARVGHQAVTSRGGYFLVAPSARPATAATNAFRDWILEAASQFG